MEKFLKPRLGGFSFAKTGNRLRKNGFFSFAENPLTFFPPSV